MKIRYIGDYYRVYLEKGKLYEAELVDDLYRIVDDDDGMDYGYPVEEFEVVEDELDEGPLGSAKHHDLPSDSKIETVSRYNPSSMQIVVVLPRSRFKNPCVASGMGSSGIFRMLANYSPGKRSRLSNLVLPVTQRNSGLIMRTRPHVTQSRRCVPATYHRRLIKSCFMKARYRSPLSSAQKASSTRALVSSSNL